MPEVRIVYRDEKTGELKAEIVDTEDYEFTIATRGSWKMLIADEDVEFKAGEVKPVRIRRTPLPRESIVLRCPVTRHAFGYVASLGRRGEPQPIEEDRELNYVIFKALDNGTIRKGDLIGVVNIFPVMMVRRAKKPKKVREE
ncbi:hypothetical protein Asulf_01753 [Archaeoglobus sulfaticallidus PM70-1]|uniref:DUF22 domain-containing protein n=1 Tax=Archaeoglobus sulfaticallidus PM70-1 TaxID=387631 RepID=N0BDL2_9EURY|nr:DUF22 domain-containing protein [Archaeoglobus sulfaticallidus]AGK61724.1 hypothetical protein Asulf_01753 [Archaeoglobus sulfaticallidus PM70-1]